MNFKLGLSLKTKLYSDKHSLLILKNEFFILILISTSAILILLITGIIAFDLFTIFSVVCLGIFSLHILPYFKFRIKSYEKLIDITNSYLNASKEDIIDPDFTTALEDVLRFEIEDESEIEDELDLNKEMQPRRSNMRYLLNKIKHLEKEIKILRSRSSFKRK